jgi:hypothetical protein
MMMSLKYEESKDDSERLMFYDNGTAMIIRYSPMTGKFNKAILPITREQYDRWRGGRTLIQDAMPHLSSDEREFLMTGYTPEDWERMVDEEED